MKIIKPSYTILTNIESFNILKGIEAAGRTCYKSEENITDVSCIKFIKNLLERGHESVLEHEKLTIKFINDRGISHEQVRHRLCSFSQESTRFINYTKENKGGEISVIDISKHLKNPEVSLEIWFKHMINCEKIYKAMIDAGESPEISRSVLPNSLKTEIVISANLRQWREIFRQRCSPAAHPQYCELMRPLLTELKERIPVIFDDIEY